MSLENRKCRRPIAAELNKLGLWLPFPNVAYRSGARMFSGRPDGEYRTPEGDVIDVEFKAHEGSVYLGNPNNPEDTSGWHASQRNWWRFNSQRSRVPYLIVMWCYPPHEDKKFKAKKQRFYVLSPMEYLDLETMAYMVDPENPRHTIAAFQGFEKEIKYRHLSLESAGIGQCYAAAGDAALYIDRYCRLWHRNKSTSINL